MKIKMTLIVLIMGLLFGQTLHCAALVAGHSQAFEYRVYFNTSCLANASTLWFGTDGVQNGYDFGFTVKIDHAQDDEQVLFSAGPIQCKKLNNIILAITCPMWMKFIVELNGNITHISSEHAGNTYILEPSAQDVINGQANALQGGLL